jgi:coproporphyrinogen III oxidase
LHHGLLGATVRHATVGTYFSEQQRKEISEAMQTVSAVHQKQIQRWDREHGGGGQAAASSGNGKTLTMTAIQQAAKDHGVSVDEAKRQAQAAGYNIQ